jgi:hypothetical protein
LSLFDGITTDLAFSRHSSLDWSANQSGNGISDECPFAAWSGPMEISDKCTKTLEQLPNMSRPELHRLWQELFGKPAHPKLRRQLLVPILAMLQLLSYQFLSLLPWYKIPVSLLGILQLLSSVLDACLRCYAMILPLE